ncbi:electron transfer flavoprotein subunit beta/FixA family protein [Arthrobacter sp. MA-N2]|uniref:electron transfer flavoprotein subunit beta/FixA family protein n=1 Tax=Arthrobacter sp. MA-N2 TaxID=1101188 RepID=UPI00048965C2|nr:electron transfer flavoprotein subunit beta/FixA family protein [Arthrobacter sp. MA-N2]
MRIAVLLKEVPDTYGERKLNLETGLANRGATDAVLDEVGERALELALTYADGHPDSNVTVLSMGPESVVSTLRKGMAMGATDAVHVLDDGLLGADLSLTAEALAAALRRRQFDLVIAGNISTDGSGGVLPAMIAELLCVPQLTGLNSVSIEETSVSGRRVTESGVVSVRTELPAVVSITEALPAGRFPSFKGLMAAKKKPLEVLSLAELGVDAGDESAGRSIVIAVAERPARAAGVKIVDEGDAAAQLVNFLVTNRLA